MALTPPADKLVERLREIASQAAIYDAESDVLREAADALEAAQRGLIWYEKNTQQLYEQLAIVTEQRDNHLNRLLEERREAEALRKALDEKLSIEAADRWLAHRFNQVWNEKVEAEAREAGLREALRDLHAEVEMAESIGICLPDRVPSLKAGEALTAHPLEQSKRQAGSE